MARALTDLESLDDFLSGEPMVDPIRQELQTIIAEPLARLRVHAMSVGTTLTVTLADQLPHWIEVDPHRLRQVVSLALSAIIHRHAKSQLDLRVFVTPLRNEPTHAHLHFDISGRPALVELDHAEDPSLLLATRTLAVAGGQSAWFPAAGVDFRLTLPVRLLPDLAEPSTIRAAVDQTESRPLAIVVDDHMSMRSLMTTLLTARGYRVVSTSKPERAEEVFADKRPKLVVTDLFMPRVNGLELIERLRAADPLHETRFLLVTAHLTTEVIQKALSLDAAVIPKPISPQRLDEALGKKEVA
jgi:CheY-like chemotaxis protein